MVGSIIYNIFITPLEYLFEVVFSLIYRWTNLPAVAIIGLSLAMNFLVLPLYRRADKIQEEERDKVASMAQWVNHIKKTFKGDERYMMLNTYYRQQNYKPIYALRSSFSLLLQIPFFIAAYHYLSHLSLLEGESFLFLSNLGAPDQILHIGTITINVMPIVMTLINLVSGFIYLRGFPLKDKLQTYGIAVIFLILLYNSPSGLVFYWTLNQVFSMLKNVFMKLIKNRKVMNIVFSAIGFIFVVVFLLLFQTIGPKRILAIAVLFLLCQMPLIMSLVQRNKKTQKEPAKAPKYRVFLFGGIFMSIFAGVVIPLSVISASPVEFVTSSATPASLVLNNLSTAVGYFIVWFGIFYYLANPKARRVFSYILWMISGIAIVDFMFFGKNLGNLSIYLIFDSKPEFLPREKILNLIIIVGLIIVLFFFMYFLERFVPYVYLALIIGTVALSVMNGSKVQRELQKTAAIQGSEQSYEKEKILPLSKTGKNVVVFMLDRAISGFIPYVFNEKPELLNSYSGFTYYPNTISFGISTNTGSPALFGGYEYRPWQLNERDSETLEAKQNESLKVMPKIFSDAGYEVTVCDPPYAGYQWVSDLSIYDGMENVHAYHTMGEYVSDEEIRIVSGNSEKQIVRNFFFYSIFKSVPLVLQNTVYDDGLYYSTDESFQGMDAFMNSYSVLESLPEMTEIVDSNINTFLMIDNDTTHEPVFLEWPDYTPNSNLAVRHLADEDIYNLGTEKLVFQNDIQVQHYDVNMAAYIQIAKWLDFLRENEVYDNTRIILVSDHGRFLELFPKLMLDDFNAETVNPLLFVKDFYSEDFTISNEFMTNADVPTIAFNGLVNNPINPYTGRALNNNAKYSEKMLVTSSANWDIMVNNGNTFDTSDGKWFEVRDNIFDKSNWQVLEP